MVPIPLYIPWDGVVPTFECTKYCNRELGILKQTFCIINSASVLCLSMIHYTVSSAFGCCKPWLVTAVLQVTISSPKLMHHQQVVVGPVQNTAQQAVLYFEQPSVESLCMRV